MKILQAINCAAPAGGGPIESILQAHRILAERGHSMDVVCLDPPGAPWLRDLPCRVHALGPAFSAYRYSRRYVPWLARNAPLYDCTIVNGVWIYPSFGVWRVLPRLNRPYFVYTHGMLDPSLRPVFPFRHLKKAAYWRLVEHRVLRDAGAVFFTCEEEQRLASKSFRPFTCRSEIVPYCVGSPPGSPQAQKAAFLAAFPDLKDKRLLLFLSRIHPKKGCDLLIRALAKAGADAPALHLVMAGPDDRNWLPELRAMARAMGIDARITWTGMLTGDLKWGAFRAAEAFILPSHQENFGIAVVEALACGVPVLITDKINIWREIVADSAGWVGSDDADGTAALIRRWASLPSAGRERARESARACFAKRFRSSESAAALLDALHRHGVPL